MKKLLFLVAVLLGVGFFNLPSANAVPGALPSTYNLKEGDVVGASAYGDPDIFIINSYGYKRLFLNPKIFGFYGHLGGFSKVKPISSTARDQFETSLYFKNCETNDPRVYALAVTGEDTGTLHHLNISGSAAVQQDPHFFNKIFCINNNEFNWYSKGVAYTALSQVPAYNRTYSPVSQNYPCTGFQSMPPIINSNNVAFADFRVNTSNCAKGVAVMVATSSTFSGEINVGQIYATGEQSISTNLCGSNSNNTYACVSYQPSQQLYYRVIDLSNKAMIFTGSPFNTPGTSTQSSVSLYTFHDTNIPFTVQYPSNTLCYTQNIFSVVLHDRTSPCGGNNAINTTQHYMVVSAIPSEINTQAELIAELQANNVTILGYRTIAGQQAIYYNDAGQLGWTFVTNKTTTLSGQSYKYVMVIEANWGTMAGAQEAENMILNSLTIPQ